MKQAKWRFLYQACYLPRMRDPHLEPLPKIHEYQGPLGVKGMDNTPQCVHSMPAVNWQPAMLKSGGHHGGIAGPSKTSSAAAGGCMPGENLTCLSEDVCIEHPRPKTRSTQSLAGMRDHCSVRCIWTKLVI